MGTWVGLSPGCKMRRMSENRPVLRLPGATRGGSFGLLAVAIPLFLCLAPLTRAQQANWSAQEAPIARRINTLRSLPDDVRAETTRQLALEIRGLPAGLNKVKLANGLASLSTEGDFGHTALQEVAATLAQSLTEHSVPDVRGQPAFPYLELATLVRYEHVEAAVDSPQFAAAMSKLQADDQRRAQADFTLPDLQGRTWSLRSLHGKVVLVNFWATWCPPCRKEIPDLESLYQRFQKQGLIILGISSDDIDKIKTYAGAHGMTYPVLLDQKREASNLFAVEGIPASFVYDRSGKLVAEALDMRTESQFVKMLEQAGL